MASNGKLIVKIQLKMTEEDKKNLDHDIPMLAEQIKDQTGTIITRSDFLRLVLEDLHHKISRHDPIAWPPKLELAPKLTKPRMNKARE